jgi:hypothetical protein
MAQAIPNPYDVLVPLPNSSINTNDLLVAERSIVTLYIISLMNVEIPLICISDAPTLVIIESTMDVSNYFAGT